MHKLKTFLSAKPLFLYLLPVFFVLHGCNANFDFIPVTDAMLLTLIYIAASLVIMILFFLAYRDILCASLAAFLVMSFNFFFGVIHDSLKNILPGSFLVKYSFLLPAAVVIFVILFFWINKIRTRLATLTLYLNVLLLVLIVVDVIGISLKAITARKTSPLNPGEFTKCDTCSKPDVYFILADEYAGHEELKDLFSFDNSAFETDLSNRGFQVISNSFSNYNYTPFSLASILNMKYLQLRDTLRTGADLTYTYQQIRSSTVKRFFDLNGYRFYNYSVFDFEGQPAPVQENILPVRTRLITAQTFTSRFYRDLWFNTITMLKSKRILKNFTYGNLRNNNHIYNLTSNLAQQKTSEPKFVYAHLMMPHYPYYYDKDGKELPFERVVEGNQHHREDYAGYLQYCNKKLLAMVDHIQQASQRPPIIIIMGDHGFRHFIEPVARKYYFLNFTAVYFPGGNHQTLPDSASSVNLFREILNKHFAQQLPILSDSSIYLRD